MKNAECRIPKPREASFRFLHSAFNLLPSSLAQYAPRTLKHDLRMRGALPVGECLQIALSLNLDPRFAPGWSALAEIYSRLDLMERTPPRAQTRFEGIGAA